MDGWFFFKFEYTTYCITEHIRTSYIVNTDYSTSSLNYCANDDAPKKRNFNGPSLCFKSPSAVFPLWVTNNTSQGGQCGADTIRALLLLYYHHSLLTHTKSPLAQLVHFLLHNKLPEEKITVGGKAYHFESSNRSRHFIKNCTFYMHPGA